MERRPLGNVIDSRYLQFRNTFEPREVNVVGNVMSLSKVQPSKTLLGNAVTPSGIAIFVNCTQPAKALAPILCTDAGIATFVNSNLGQSANKASGIAFNEVGMFAVVSLLQAWNALLPISSTLLGMDIEVISLQL
jgi:hypothetical protein